MAQTRGAYSVAMQNDDEHALLQCSVAALCVLCGSAMRVCRSRWRQRFHHPVASHPNSRMTSAARICVASSFSLNMSQYLERMPSGGPPSIMSRKFAGSPTDINCAREGGLDKATYVASHRSSAEKKRGNFQWKMRPGFAVTPCNVLIVLAVRIVIGSCRLWTCSV